MAPRPAGLHAISPRELTRHGREAAAADTISPLGIGSQIWPGPPGGAARATVGHGTRRPAAMSGAVAAGLCAASDVTVGPSCLCVRN